MRIGIVGLGTAGSAVAAACVARGLDVVGVERGALAEAGARWVNGVPRWVFAHAGFTEPVGPELRCAETPYHLVGGWGPERIVLRSVLEVDMRHLVARLQAEAVAGEADLRGNIRAERLDGRILHTDHGTIDADVWVDASGITGLRLLGQPPPDRDDLCAAAQEVREIVDRPAAERFLETWGAHDGEAVCFSGIAGGYSVVSVRVHGDEVGLLTGSVPSLGHPGGAMLLRRFVDEHRWIGPTRFGGSRSIPLRRPWEVVGQGDIAAIGDAAGQVYPAHGSGIGQQLLAASMLAEALFDGRGPWGYNVEWQRTWGGLLAGSDLFRRFSSTLDAPTVRLLMRRGVLSPAMMGDALDQRAVRPSVRALATAVAGLAASPGLARRLGPVLVAMRALERLYAQYPEDPEEYTAWIGRLEWWTGVPAWPPRQS